MHVIATAGHVDHGKSTLVRALTGMEPDRWAEERRRGMTIDLGYAWTSLPSGEVAGFVDVPGHQRFIGNMLAGLGPAPAVLFVVAADEGWRRQSAEHLAAVDALGVERGVLAVTRSDLADPAGATEQARDALARTSLERVEAVQVSGATGQGLDDLRAALDRLVARAPAADPATRVRLWVDRSFTIRGAGTVVTGTLTAGTLSVGDALELDGRAVTVRGLQSLGQPLSSVTAVARVAVNLRAVARDEVSRGQALLTPGAWRSASAVDVRLRTELDLPEHLVLHVGTAAVPVRVRPLGGDHVRLQLGRPLPLAAGDRLVMREPAGQVVIGGAVVLDPSPPELRRRGAAAARAAHLGATGPDALAAEVARLGAARWPDLARLGLARTADPRIMEVGEWVVDTGHWQNWARALERLVDGRDALSRGVTEQEALAALGLPALSLLRPLADAAALLQEAGLIRRPGDRSDLGAAEAAVAEVQRRLGEQPFVPPDTSELRLLGLGTRELAAAERDQRLLRIDGDVVLLPDGPALAMRILAALPQPFTTSEARTALGTTRRVAVPLLEHLDRRGWTRRLDGMNREVCR